MKEVKIKYPYIGFMGKLHSLCDTNTLYVIPRVHTRIGANLIILNHQRIINCFK